MTTATMDYEEIGSYFSMMIDRVNNYLTVRNDQDGSYLSASGQSYSAIKKQVQNLQGYTLREYQSYIWEKGVAKNNFRCIDDLNELNRTLRWDEMSDSQKSAIYMTILDNYNNKMVSSVLIPTYDNDGAFYMSRTKIGIDDLALQANELLARRWRPRRASPPTTPRSRRWNSSPSRMRYRWRRPWWTTSPSSSRTS